jgi:hypothetical protein
MEGKMKNVLSKTIFFVVILFVFSLFLTAQDISIKITPDRDRIIRLTGNPPTFQIKTYPNSVVSIEVANNSEVFNDMDLQSDDNFFSSYEGSEYVDGQEIKANNNGQATYQLPKEPWIALTSKLNDDSIRVLIYYRALVIKPDQAEEEITYDVLGWSLDDEEWKNAPSIEVYVTAEEAKAKGQFDKGIDLYMLKNFEDAVEEFLSAWGSEAEPILQIWIGRCYQRLALQHFEDYSSDLRIEESKRKIAQDYVHEIEELLKKYSDWMFRHLKEKR